VGEHSGRRQPSVLAARTAGACAPRRIEPRSSAVGRRRDHRRRRGRTWRPRR
jgi:hypothetical protein